ncbi:MAG: hypothetical protein AAFX87_13380 [Bacteroidota bacterium]
MIRIVFVLILVAGVFYLFAKIFGSSKEKICSRCDGKGYWEGTRSREKCEWCGGTGYIPKDFVG